MVVEKTGPVSYRIRDQLTGSVSKVHSEHLRAASIEEWEIPTTERPLRKIVLAAPMESSDSDSESGAKQADFPVRKCRHKREKSDDESDVPFMERCIMTRRKTADKNESTVDKEVGMGGGITSNSSTFKDDCPKGDTSESTYEDKEVSERSLGSDMSDVVQVGQTPVGAKRADTLTCSTDEHKTKKEQLKSLVDLRADML